jgi:hypothetical protein
MVDFERRDVWIGWLLKRSMVREMMMSTCRGSVGFETRGRGTAVGDGVGGAVVRVLR